MRAIYSIDYRVKGTSIECLGRSTIYMGKGTDFQMTWSRIEKFSFYNFCRVCESRRVKKKVVAGFGWLISWVTSGAAIESQSRKRINNWSNPVAFNNNYTYVSLWESFVNYTVYPFPSQLWYVFKRLSV